MESVEQEILTRCNAVHEEHMLADPLYSEIRKCLFECAEIADHTAIDLDNLRSKIRQLRRALVKRTFELSQIENKPPTKERRERETEYTCTQVPEKSPSPLLPEVKTEVFLDPVCWIKGEKPK